MSLPFRHVAKVAIALPLLAAIFLNTGAAQDDAKSDAKESSDAVAEQAVIKAWQQYYRRVAGAYEIRIGGQAPRTLQLIPTPIQSYSNPVRGRQQHGSIFLWTDAGRPAVLGSIWSITEMRSPTNRFATHEFLTLSESHPVEGALSAPEELGVTNINSWIVDRSGVQWEAVPAPPNSTFPKMNARLAKLQLRRIARRFTADLIPRNSTGKEQLRLLEKPIYEYETKERGAVGALFSFALATDPEVVLWLESRPTDDSPDAPLAFFYAPARMSLLELNLYLDGQKVWTDPDVRQTPSPNYSIQFRVGTFPADEPPKAE